MPRVSVVVPIYNVEAYLAECLDSIAGRRNRELVRELRTEDLVALIREQRDARPPLRVRFARRIPGRHRRRLRGLVDAVRR